MKEFLLSIFSSKIPVTKEEYAEIVKIQKYKSFMDMSGQYDDREDRKLRKDWENEIKLLELKWNDLVSKSEFERDVFQYIRIKG